MYKEFLDEPKKIILSGLKLNADNKELEAIAACLNNKHKQAEARVKARIREALKNK